MLKESVAKKRDEELKRALAEKPVSPEFVKPMRHDTTLQAPANPDYVPPPPLDLQKVMDTPRRRPLPSEVNQEREQVSGMSTVEQLKVEIANDIRRGPEGPTREATEEALAENVRRIKVQLAQQGYNERLAEARDRQAAAVEANVDFIRAELSRTVHTEDYS